MCRNLLRHYSSILQTRPGYAAARRYVQYALLHIASKRGPDSRDTDRYVKALRSGERRSQSIYGTLRKVSVRFRVYGSTGTVRLHSVNYVDNFLQPESTLRIRSRTVDASMLGTFSIRCWRISWCVNEPSRCPHLPRRRLREVFHGRYWCQIFDVERLQPGVRILVISFGFPGSLWHIFQRQSRNTWVDRLHDLFEF